MSEKFDIQTYLTHGVEKIVADALRATLKDPRESAFMAKFAVASRNASKRRAAAETSGEHVPPFLIASITSSCNLHCAGCYSRCNHATVDTAPVAQLTAEEWLRIFREADEMGVSFILLAGGEPMLRRDILQAAGKLQNIIFPVFTNNDSNAAFWTPFVKNNIKTGDAMLKPPRQEGGNKHGINRSTEQKLQRGVQHLRWRQEETKVGDLSFL